MYKRAFLEDLAATLQAEITITLCSNYCCNELVMTLFWSRHKLLLICLLGSSITVLSSCSLQNRRTIQIAGVADEPKHVAKIGPYEIQFFTAENKLPASILIARSTAEACSIKIQDEKLQVMFVRKRETPSRTCDLLPTPGEFEDVKRVQESRAIKTADENASRDDEKTDRAATSDTSSAEDMTSGAVGDGYSAVEELGWSHDKAVDSDDSGNSITSDSADTTNGAHENCAVFTENDILRKDNNESYDFMLLRLGKDVDESTIVENGTCKLGSEVSPSMKSLR